MECITELNIAAFVAVHHPVAPNRQRDARSVSLAALLKDLEREGVAKLIIESRGVQDRDDRGTILDAQRAGLVSHDLRYDFAGKEEPLLWLADAVAGICRMLSLVETSPDWWHCNKP